MPSSPTDGRDDVETFSDLGAGDFGHTGPGSGRARGDSDPTSGSRTSRGSTPVRFPGRIGFLHGAVGTRRTPFPVSVGFDEGVTHRRRGPAREVPRSGVHSVHPFLTLRGPGSRLFVRTRGGGWRSDPREDVGRDGLSGVDGHWCSSLRWVPGSTPVGNSGSRSPWSSPVCRGPGGVPGPT